MCRDARRVSIVGSLLAAVFSCGNPAVDAVEYNAERWHDQHILDYAYILKIDSFDGRYLHGVRIEVRDGKVASAVLVTHGLPVLDRVPTIVDLFDRVAHALADEPQVFHVQFDSVHHYIDNFEYDPDEGVADDGGRYKVTCFPGRRPPAVRSTKSRAKSARRWAAWALT